MIKSIRSLAVLAVAGCLAGSMGFAQATGEAVYKANCQSCHGSTGTPSPGIAKAMGVKAASDPEMKKLSLEDEIKAVKEGKGKMKPFGGKLTDQQIKDSVTYYRTLK
jgi:mono/diheme cytochrome c family protein